MQVYHRSENGLGEVLRTKDFLIKTKIKDVSITLNKGEIVGIAGLVGAEGRVGKTDFRN